MQAEHPLVPFAYWILALPLDRWKYSGFMLYRAPSPDHSTVCVVWFERWVPSSAVRLQNSLLVYCKHTLPHLCFVYHRCGRIVMLNNLNNHQTVKLLTHNISGKMNKILLLIKTCLHKHNLCVDNTIAAPLTVHSTRTSDSTHQVHIPH